MNRPDMKVVVLARCLLATLTLVLITVATRLLATGPTYQEVMFYPKGHNVHITSAACKCGEGEPDVYFRKRLETGWLEGEEPDLAKQEIGAGGYDGKWKHLEPFDLPDLTHNTRTVVGRTFELTDAGVYQLWYDCHVKEHYEETDELKKIYAIAATLSDPGDIEVGSQKQVTVTTSPNEADALARVTFVLENTMRHKCETTGCNHGGEAEDTAGLTDSVISPTDDKVKVEGKRNGKGDLVVKVANQESDRKSFRVVSCPCGEKPSGSLWHLLHCDFNFSSTWWGTFGALDKANPTAYNCFAYALGITTQVIEPGTPPVTIAWADALYRDNGGLKSYASRNRGPRFTCTSPMVNQHMLQRSTRVRTARARQLASGAFHRCHM